MWQKLKEQLPAVLLTAILIIGAAFWFIQKTVADMTMKQQAEIPEVSFSRQKGDALPDHLMQGPQLIPPLLRETDLFPGNLRGRP